MEKYKPSDEEIKNAEETMIKKQIDLSEIREKQSKALENLGVSGYLYKEFASFPYGHTERNTNVYGKLNGHKIEMWHDGDGYEVNIDDEPLDSTKALEVGKKYYNLAIDSEEEDHKIWQVDRELQMYSSEKNVEEVLSEIL